MDSAMLLSQATLYVIAFILSFFIFPPIAKNQSDFNGKCLLFSSGKWDATRNRSEMQLDVTWGQVGSCNFAVFVGIIVLLVSLLYTVSTAIHLYKGTEQSWLSSFISVILTGVFSALLMVGGIVVTSGFQQWCDLIQKRSACDVAPYEIFEINHDPSIDKTGYFTQFSMAKFGLWASFVCWVLLTATAMYKLFKYHQNEDILVSMNRERQRLIQSVNPHTENI